EGTQGYGQAERQSPWGTGVQRAGIQSARRGAIPGEIAFGRILCGMEGQIRRPGLGAARKIRRQAVVARFRIMADAELTEGMAGEVVQSPRRRPALADVEHVLGLLVEIPAALLVVAEIMILFAGVVARYGLHSPLIWSDELASILFLWLAMLGAAVAFRRAEHMRMTAMVA